MSEAQAHGNHGGHPTVGSYETVYKHALQSSVHLKQYGDALADALDHLRHMNPEELAKTGIIAGGRVKADALRDYVNSHIGKGLIGQYFGDPEDPRFIANFTAIKNAVITFGAKGLSRDLLNQIGAAYSTTASNEIDENTQLAVAAMSFSEGKQVARQINKYIGNQPQYRKMIDDAQDPNDVAGIVRNMLREVHQKTAQAEATGESLEDIVGSHDAHGANGGHAVVGAPHDEHKAAAGGHGGH